MMNKALTSSKAPLSIKMPPLFPVEVSFFISKYFYRFTFTEIKTFHHIGCQALNYLPGDKIERNATTLSPYNILASYSPDGSQTYNAVTTSIFAPFFTPSGYMDLLKSNGLLGSY